jgi:hypothetical protein
MLLDRCPWYIAGPLLGGLIVAFRAAINRPLGALGGYIDLIDHMSHPSRLGMSSYLLAGIVIGGGLFGCAAPGSVASGALYQGVLPAVPLLQAVILILAGVAMGIGARTAGGCTSGRAGQWLGLPVAVGLLAGVRMQRALAGRAERESHQPAAAAVRS